jgi:hypothetical protein
MEVDGSGAPAVLGLDGFALGGAVEQDGELVMIVETTAAVAGCSGCGTRARSKGRPVVVVTGHGLRGPRGSTGVAQASLALSRR